MIMEMEVIRMNIKNNKNCKTIINDEEVEKYIIKPETADNMFEKLGYKIDGQETKLEVEYINDDKKIIYFDKYRKVILSYNEYDENTEELTLQDLQAINKKCMELRLAMMNKCKYLTIRTKNYEKYFYCRLNKKIINYTTECIKCVKNEPRKNKGINKKTSKQIKLEKSRYSILTNDLEHCYICRFQGKKVLRDDLHEVYGGANRKRSILNGLVVPLCRKHHQNEEILSELKVATQQKYEVNHTRDEFIKLIGKSYIK